MLTLLPEQRVKQLKKEYQLRLLTVIILMVTIAVAVGAVALIPSYILSQEQQVQAEQDAALFKKGTTDNGSTQAQKELASAGKLISALNNHVDGTPLSGFVEIISAYHNPQVSLTSFEISRQANSAASSSSSSSSLSLRLLGLARTREALVAFKKNLEQDKHITKVDLPISDLAKSKDIQFTLSVNATW